MNLKTNLAISALFLCFLVPQPTWAAEPPEARTIFMDPNAARMAEDLAKGMPNAVLLGRLQGVAMDARGRGGMRPIHYVTAFAHERSLSSLRALVGAGASVEMEDDSGRTPLGLASLRRDGEATRILLGFGAKASHLSGGKIPILIAIESGNKAAFEILSTSGSPLLGADFPLGSAARSLLANAHPDWLFWMGSRGMLSGRSLGPEFWRDLCADRSPAAQAVARDLALQPQSLSCQP